MRRQRQYKKRTKSKIGLMLLFVSVMTLIFNYLRPLPATNASILPIVGEVDSVRLSWPSRGYAALGAKDFGVLETHGAQNERPTASLAKLITALAVLEKHPLKKGQQGPSITLTAADVAIFEKYFSLGGSVVKVAEGEKITQYQALQAMLLPSANNMADSVAIWAFGSMDGYHRYATAMVKRLGLRKTTVAVDASGMSPQTTSTPGDLIRLGEFAMDNPVIAEIVAQPSATIPVHGVISSANSRLGYNNIIGIKTGLTDQAGGCFLFAAKYTIQNKPVMIIGVILGAETLRAALADSEPLLNSAKPYFDIRTPIKAGQAFADLTAPWLAGTQAVAQKDVTLLTWRGASFTPHIELGNIQGSLPAGAKVGTALISSGNNTASTPLVLREGIAGPGWQWRLRRL